MEMTEQWTIKDKAKLVWDLARGFPNSRDRQTLREIFNLCASVQKKYAAVIECQQLIKVDDDRFTDPTDRMVSHFNRPNSVPEWKTRWKDIYPNLNKAKTAFHVFNELAYHHTHLASDILETGDETAQSYGQLIGSIADELTQIADKCNSLSKRMNKRLGTMVRQDRFRFIPFMD